MRVNTGMFGFRFGFWFSFFVLFLNSINLNILQLDED